jgi:ABC-2 type transport system permease protein
VAICFAFTAAGSPLVTEFLSARTPTLAEIARALSVADRFNDFTRGVVALRDLVFFGSFVAFFLFLNAVVLDHRKAD